MSSIIISNDNSTNDRTTNKQHQQQKLHDLDTPAFVINVHAFRKNCQRILNTAADHNVRVRPHIKTHKTLQGALIQAAATGEYRRGSGGSSGSGSNNNNTNTTTFCTAVFHERVVGFCVSTIPELELLFGTLDDNLYPCNRGDPFKNVIYALPISKPKLQRLQSLRAKGQLHILIDHPQQVAMVEEFSKDQCNNDTDHNNNPWSVFLKLDTGYHRAGTTCDERGLELAKRIIQSSQLNLTGVYSHCGHSYDVNTAQEMNDIAKADLEQIQTFLGLLKQAQTDISVDDLIVSVGSTPSFPYHANDKDHVISNLEVHPGNYTLYDRQQLWTGACPTEADQAGRVLATVIGQYEDHILLDAGATALSKDGTPQGGMCAITGHPELECYSMSQEVTRVRNRNDDGKTSSPPQVFEKLPIGSKVVLIPNHSCLAAACFERYSIIDDPGCTFPLMAPVIDEWIPAKFF